MMNAQMMEIDAIEFSRSLSNQAIPCEALMLFNAGVQRLQAGDAPGALAALSQSIQQVPAFPEAHVFLGIANALTNKIYHAIDHLEIAANLDPDSFAAHYTLAQLNFKLRIPQKGYEAAEQALRCVRTLEQRKILAELLREERACERNGIARPWFNKPFSRSALFLAGSGLAAAVMAIAMHIH